MSATAMIIESIIKRKGGSVVTIGAATYHFKPDADDRHIAPVTDPDHLARFLQIPEGYRLVGTVAMPQAPASADLAPASVESPEPPMPEVTPGKPLEDMTDEELRATFKLEIGRVAPPKTRMETMIEQIQAMRAARATAA